jgi:hypothetical protein
MDERHLGGEKRRGKKFEERINANINLQEAEEGTPRRIRIEGAITANIVNGNGRRYPSPVLETAVAELRNHLNESAGQGRAIQVLGEAEHPSDKGGRPNLLETVTKWDEVSFNGQRVDVTGHILETSKGKDILTLMEGGVMPGVSLRGYGEGKNVKSGDEKIFEVTELHITGFDLVLEPSFENSVTLIESQNQSSEDEMNAEEFKKLVAENPDLFKEAMGKNIEEWSESRIKKTEKELREKLGIDEKADLGAALTEASNAVKTLKENERKAALDKAIEEATKDLPFGKKLNEKFVEALKASGAKSAEEVKTFAEAKRKEYDSIAAALNLKNMGFIEGKRIDGIASVLEEETGTPEYARASFEIVESLRASGRVTVPRRKQEDMSRSEIVAKMMLKRFDKLFMDTVDDHGQRAGLLMESKRFEEAEVTTDLNLPYAVSRAIYEIAWPTLVAAGIFDVGVMDTTPTLLYFKHFAGETGFFTQISGAEAIVLTLQATWYAMAHGEITPDTVVVKNSAENTTYVEGTDYVIDYGNGAIMSLVGGAIAAAATVHVTAYSYTAVRQGELVPIERAKVTMDNMIIKASAMRLADQISREAVVFSRSQLGYDAVGQTMAALIMEAQRLIDRNLLMMAYTAVKKVANNSTAAWTVGTSQDDLDELVRLMGSARIITNHRFYPATWYLMSDTNAERLGHWKGFTRLGFPTALLNQAGFAGGVNGIPVFYSTEFPDSLIIAGQQELVAHRVFQPMLIKGPYPTYDVSNGTSKLLGADQYYAEEFNTSVSPIPLKGAFVPITGGSS